MNEYIEIEGKYQKILKIISDNGFVLIGQINMDYYSFNLRIDVDKSEKKFVNTLELYKLFASNGFNKVSVYYRDSINKLSENNAWENVKCNVYDVTINID